MAEEIGAPGSERHPTLLADFEHSGTLSAGKSWEPSEQKLEKDEVAEIEYIEIFAPVKADGTIEDLKQVTPIIDGAMLEEFVSLSGRYDSNMAPPRTYLYGGASPLQDVRVAYRFGKPGVSNPLENTTLNAKDSIGVRAVAGESDVTADFRVRVWGYLYKTEGELREVFGDRIYGEEATIVDVNRGRELRFTKDAIDVSIDNWDMFAGGVHQSKPEVMPIIRFAYNAKATTPNANYEFDYNADEVANRWENMFFNFGTKEALLIKGIGVRSPTHLKYMGVKLGDHEYPKPSLFRVDPTSNPLHFGHGQPLFPVDFPVFLPIPTLPYGYLVNNEKGRVIVRDDGTSISADQIIAAMYGIIVKLP